jgi:hypothetical protein
MSDLVHQCWGIPLSDRNGLLVDSKTLAFLRDWAKICPQSPDLEHWGSPDDWEISDLSDFVWDILGYEEWVWTTYSDKIFPPIVLGFWVRSWPVWDLMGPDGYLFSSGRTSPELLAAEARFSEEVPEEARALLDKHDLAPRVFWALGSEPRKLK